MPDGIGPVEYLIIEFPGNHFSGEIVPALAELVDSGTIRIIDLVFLHKDPDGSVSYGEFDADDLDRADLFGALSFETSSLLSEEDLLHAAEALAPNSSAGLLVWENSWAARLAGAVRNANGQIVAHERIPHAVIEAALAFSETI